jgi:hypothetical protein
MNLSTVVVSMQFFIARSSEDLNNERLAENREAFVFSHCWQVSVTPESPSNLHQPL